MSADSPAQCPLTAGGREAGVNTAGVRRQGQFLSVASSLAHARFVGPCFMMDVQCLPPLQTPVSHWMRYALFLLLQVH